MIHRVQRATPSARIVRRLLSRWAWLLVIAAVAGGFGDGIANGKNSGDEATSRIKVEVRAGEQDKPVANASVYVRFEQGRRHKLAEMNLKTNEDGTTKVPAVPRGRVEIQVIAPGWKTFGRWYDVEKEEELIQIKLEPRPKWY